jgi:hypothetical protein
VVSTWMMVVVVSTWIMVVVVSTWMMVVVVSTWMMVVVVSTWMMVVVVSTWIMVVVVSTWMMVVVVSTWIMVVVVSTWMMVVREIEWDRQGMNAIGWIPRKEIVAQHLDAKRITEVEIHKVALVQIVAQHLDASLITEVAIHKERGLIMSNMIRVVMASIWMTVVREIEWDRQGMNAIGWIPRKEIVAQHLDAKRIMEVEIHKVALVQIVAQHLDAKRITEVEIHKVALVQIVAQHLDARSSSWRIAQCVYGQHLAHKAGLYVQES